MKQFTELALFTGFSTPQGQISRLGMVEKMKPSRISRYYSYHHQKPQIVKLLAQDFFIYHFLHLLVTQNVKSEAIHRLHSLSACQQFPDC